MRGIMIETTVNYTREYQGRLDLIQHVPERVCQETGNEFFAPETVEHVQELIHPGATPAPVIETPVDP
jgi:YgiT-type zinc finger domain-containing protein